MLLRRLNLAFGVVGVVGMVGYPIAGFKAFFDGEDEKEEEKECVAAGDWLEAFVGVLGVKERSDAVAPTVLF